MTPFSRPTVKAAATALLAATLLSGCARNNEIDVTSGVGITATRSLCPAVGVPTYTGDVTIFDPANSRDAAAIDVVASITNVRTTCNEQGERVYVAANFDVVATRREAGPDRVVELPYFATILQGGSSVVAKDDNVVRIHFPAGQLRGTAQGTGGAYVNRSSLELPAEIRERITRRRRAGDADAAIDPLSETDVRAAVTRSTFELLVGFQLSQEQLQYNVTR